MSMLWWMISMDIWAMPFGVYDPRSIAMGGAGVASADSANAVFFNPSLLAQYKTRKHRARNSHFVFPVASFSASRLLEDINDFDKDDPEQALSDSITAYNANPSQTTATDVASATKDLQRGLSTFAGESVFFNAFLGLTIGIGDKREGGAFVFSRRAIGDGLASLSNDDKRLMADYIEAMDFVASGGTSGAPHPELFATDGSLLDQTDNLSSTADGRSLFLTELGIAMAWGGLFDTGIDIGFTPKLAQGDTYEYNADLANLRSSSERKNNDDWHFTFDAGLSKTFNNKVKLGLVIKNVIPMDFDTASGGRIRVKPQPRIGAAFPSQWGYWAADMDLRENEAIGSGDGTRFVSLGGEWQWALLSLRAGLKQNLAGHSDNAQMAYSFGLGYRFYGWGIDTAIIDSGPEKAASLQLSRGF
jgi:hypothetical protein